MPDYQAMADQAADRYGIDRNIFRSLIQHESSWNPNAVSPAGAIGFGQLMPGTAADLGVNPYDPQSNLDGAARYLSQQLSTFGSYELALAAYDAGPGSVQNYGGIPPFAETQNYVRGILGSTPVNGRAPTTQGVQFNVANPTSADFPVQNPGTTSTQFNDAIDPRGNYAPRANTFTPVNNGNDLLSQLLAAALAGGSSNSGPPLSYYDGQTSQGQQVIDAAAKQSQWQNEFDTSQFNWKKYQDAVDAALAQGDLDLARQKQVAADYWQGQTNALQERMNTQDNQTSMATTQISAQAQLQAAAIAAESDRYAAQTRLQGDLAAAHNDQERNKIMLAHEQEMANIARMEDETKRAIASQQNQIAGFDAETSRASQMGDLALKNNQFILDASTNPRDLFGLFMMQRGVTPDWNTLMNGGAAVQGDPLTVTNPMNAYKPTGVLPQNYSIGNTQTGQVGQSANSVGLQSNPYMNMGQVAAPNINSTLNTQGIQMPDFKPTATTQGPPQLPRTPTDINPGGFQGGVPAAALQPGMNLSTVGSDIMGSDFNTGTAYYDQGKTRAVNPNDQIARGTQVWIDYPMPRAAFGTDEQQGYAGALNDAQGRYNSAQSTSQIPMMQNMPFNEPSSTGNANAPRPPARPGFTQAPQFMVGDAANPNPSAGGARPEIIQNPTNAPIRVIPHPQNMQQQQQPMLDFGMRPQRQVPQFPPMQQSMFNFDPRVRRPMTPPQMTSYFGGRMPMRRFAEGTDPFANLDPQTLQILMEMGMLSPEGMQQQQQPMPMMPASTGQGMINPNIQLDTSQIRDFRSGGMKRAARTTSRAPYPGPVPTPRYALGTDVSEQYANTGLGQLYLQSSSNPYASNYDLPQGLQMLSDYGVPLSPSLVNSATGGIMPTLNTANAFNQLGGGVLPSLQTFGKQTKGETENFRGYAEGVIGANWADVVDYLGKPTQNLGTAKRAQGSLF